ncbi:ABC transporter ATP-binding protein [Mangrovimonas spongiae]|uniref:ABC transporter ATP-binding protein n=1 Tax=Mangrovimonas spongiae TaxID=2494697 RepID=A0A428K570_9FLAO|nr:ABC transporter ATP-binding protein [Mangrovimonas spongiae]RSK41584.1 ABC transporter ATP-binding protein [Mangrovimonas spongiae]
MLDVQNIVFSYNKSTILNHVSFKAKKGENIAIIGESGSGKSTLLKLIYGEYDLNSGHISWNNQPILGPKFNLVVGYDFIKHVTQEFDLMPFTSVEENVGKHLSNFFPERKKDRVNELLEIVELSDFKNVKVKTLSGGQKQRVALARALAKAPEIILLDEPFSHIDSFKKRSLRRNVFNFLKQENITCLVATHDKNDVLGFADKVLVLQDQKVAFKDTVENLYKSPNIPLVASFFGEHNSINGQLVYANQLTVTKQSDIEIMVKRSYFKGSYYLIEGMRNGSSIFFHYDTALQEGVNVFLKID